LPACGKPFKQRDSIEHHIINDHDVDRGTTLFRTASTGEHRRTSIDHTIDSSCYRTANGPRRPQRLGAGSCASHPVPSGG
jgi:hypothetical protein